MCLAGIISEVKISGKCNYEGTRQDYSNIFELELRDSSYFIDIQKVWDEARKKICEKIIGNNFRNRQCPY